jgi:fused signal recognition particle receptor|uniref:Signal recognition particle receptor FtsY n=1 Tax=candidate division WOR-3 bacterium TaxID=2052148 RepID=A0A7C3UY65_UNCW3
MFLTKLKAGLKRTKEIFQNLFKEEDISRWEEILLSADCGVKVTSDLLARIKKEPGNRKEILKREILKILAEKGREIRNPSFPYVIMVVGVNGSGKTTTVGKLAYRFKNEGKKVIIAASDTYRDAAAQQLIIWAKKAGVEIVPSEKGQDAAAIAFDTISKAKSKGIDLVLVDTAGRLHTRKDLMAEVKKIKRVITKVKEGGPDETLLVLDATVGQNGIAQAKVFSEELGLTGIVITKLDGTAKGGIVLACASELSLPVRFIGFGEGIEDLAPFSPEEFVEALLE